MEEFKEIIWKEFNYDVSVAETLRERHMHKIETYNEVNETLAMPEIYFPGLGFLRIEFVPEEPDVEETY
tara:strand:+ start:664 stop:870 length:207 start_codon:yes stop_codon:yes gene_type:complete